MEKNLYIVRGVPGSGKSTFAQSIAKSWQIFEADKFFMKNGHYEFDYNGLKDAHEFCKRQVHKAMVPTLFNSIFYRNIVVSNTFTQEWEMKFYKIIAKKYGYKVYTIIIENRHGGVNQHGVPEDKVEQMKNRFEIKL
jgi:predicted kinase